MILTVATPEPDNTATPDEAPDRGPPTRTQRRTQKTKRKLMTAAVQLFAARGIDATSVEEITDRADVGKGTFYRHFGSKEELLECLLDDSVTRLQKAVTSACHGQPSLSGVLDRFFEASQRFFVGNRENLLLLADGRLLHGIAGQPETEPRAHLERLVSFTEELLRPYMPGWFGAAQARLIAFAVFSSIISFLSVGLLSMPPDELKKSARGLRRSFVASCIALMAHEL